VTSKFAIAAATSALLLGSAAVAQTTTETTTTTTADPAMSTSTTGSSTMASDPAMSSSNSMGAATTGSAPNVSGDLNSQLTVAPAQGTALQPASTQSTIATGSTRTTTTVTVQPKAAPVATGAGEVPVAGERG
jgi:hypothetical protein